MFRSRLFLRHYLAVTLVIVAVSLMLYSFTVPLIKSTTYEIEKAAGRNVLDVVYDLTNRIYLNIESQREAALEAHKDELRHVLGLVRSYIATVEADVQRGQLSREVARAQIYDVLREFKYGNNDYIWVADYDSVLVAHPDPRFQGADATQLLGAGSEIPAVPEMVAIARREGSGFYSYLWRRLGADHDSEKLSYFEDFSHWGVVVGTGVYLDDVEMDVRAMRQAAVSELRKVLSDIRIAKTGYVYVFDADLNMLVHPNPNIDRTNYHDRLNPVSGRPIGVELIEKADDEGGLFYQWDSPDDPDNYVYEKISWVRHFKGFDWYIGSSVYVDELRRNSDELGNRILWVALTALLLAMLLSYGFIHRLTVPIRRMAEMAQRVQSGDLSASSRISRDDEIGVLSQALDGMVAQLRSNIDTLDSSVVERTRELSQSQERQRLILDAIPAAIAYLDQDQVIRYANRLFVEAMGNGPEDLSDLALEAGMKPAFREDYRQAIEAALEGEMQLFEHVFETDAGEQRITINRLIPDRDADDRISGLFFLSRNVTEERRTEARLADAQRMKSVGQLSGGLAHDFNNLLTVILGNLSAASERYADDKSLAEYIEPAIRASRRGAEITGRLLAFSRRQTLAPEPIPVDELVADTIALLKRSLPENVYISLEIPGQPCIAHVDVGQLENALVNLAFNARDAMSDGGQLSYAVSTCELTGKERFDEAPQPGEYVEVKVTDTGTGFSDEALKRGVEPFFSTKGTGAGSGLGLSMVYGFVKQSGGFIRIGNRDEGGARIVLLLPLVQASALPEPRADMVAGADEAEWRDKLVLLVEDDPDVRQVIRRDLMDLGFGVLEAESAEEALPLLESIEDLFLMVSDVITPGELNGVELTRRAQALERELPVVLISGFTEEGILEDLDSDSVRFLRKPLDKSALRLAILELVSGIKQNHGS